MVQIKDIVFEEHYKKKVETTMESVKQQGFFQGISLIMNCIEDFEAKKIEITSKGMIDYLETLGIKKQ